MLLEGNTIIVTEGNSGIGEAIVLAAASEGANIVIDYVTNKDETNSIIAKIEAAGGRAVGVDADVSTIDDLRRLIATAVDTFGRLDVIVNNAGVEVRTSILDTTGARHQYLLRAR
jgi:glucose 1-dehydrogenase